MTKYWSKIESMIEDSSSKGELRSGQNMESIFENIKYETHYGDSLSLWIYSPPQVQWVQVDTIESVGTSFNYDVNDGSFILACRWLGLGAFFFPLDGNPNRGDDPIIIPQKFLKHYGIFQDDLRHADMKTASLSVRQENNISFVERESKKKGAERTKRGHKREQKKEQLLTLIEEKKVELADKKASPLESAIAELNEWQEQSKYNPIILNLIKAKGYKLEVDGDLIRIGS